MTKDQKTVAIGAASGVASMILGVFLLTLILPEPTIADSLAARIAYALKANLVAVIPLFIMLATVGNSRFLSEAIDPTRHAENKNMEIDGRVVENTLQQQLVFLIATLALSTVISFAYLNVIGAASVVFVLARVAFWKGYRLHPLFRAPGMAATAYLNLGLILVTLYLLL